jgi:hypothetical protein
LPRAGGGWSPILEQIYGELEATGGGPQGGGEGVAA